jgi:hypothetical protein
MTAPTSTPTTAGHGLLCSLSPVLVPASLPPDRRGRLRNGARPGDFLAAPRCGARTRAGCACRQPAMKNGRCRMHGGLSTGPRTPEGRERCRRARLTHGGYSAHVRALRAAARAHGRRVRALAALMRSRSAGHGVLRSISVVTVGARCARPPSSPTAPSSVSSRANDPWARAAHPYTNRSNGVSAGHGLHPSFSTAPLSPRARCLLTSAAPLAAFSAGHGVLPSFSSPAAIVPAGTP